MRSTILAGLAAIAVLSLAACRTGDGGASGNFRSNANKAVSSDPYAAASK